MKHPGSEEKSAAALQLWIGFMTPVMTQFSQAASFPLLFCVADMSSSAMIKDDEHEMSCGRSALSSCIMIDCFYIAQFSIFLIEAAQQATWHARTRFMCTHIFSVLGHDCHGTGHCICSSTCWIRATWLKQSAVVDSTSYDLP